MRTLAQKVRLLAWLVALAVATPAPVGAEPSGGDGPAASSAARREAGTLARPSLGKKAPRAGWRGASPALADPSDEPPEGPEGWASALDRAAPSAAGPGRPVSRPLGAGSSAASPPVYPAGDPCRLRC